MGGSTSTVMQGNAACLEIPEDNGFIFFGQVLPLEMCEEIFLNVPVKDLLKSATRVCKNWHHLLIDKNFWFRRVKIEGIKLSAASEKRLTEEEDEGKVLRILQSLSAHYGFNKNLIRNPNGQDGLRYWKVDHGGNNLIVEIPPIGSNCIPEEAGLPSQHCFVSSYATCSRSQKISLERNGIPPWMMDILKPEIKVSEWVSARWDCDSECSLILRMHGDERYTEEKVNWSSRSNDVVNSEWYQLQMVIKDYPEGLRFIRYTNRSKDLQFWAGHYGAKTTGSSVMIVP